MITNQKEIRRIYWEQTTYKDFYVKSYKRKDYSVALWFDFCDFISYLYVTEQITLAMKNRATL